MNYHLYVSSHTLLEDIAVDIANLRTICNVIVVHLGGNKNDPINLFSCQEIPQDSRSAYYLLEGLGADDELVLTLKGEFLFKCNPDIRRYNGTYSVDHAIVKSAKVKRHNLIDQWRNG